MKINGFMQGKSSSAKSEEGDSYIFLLNSNTITALGTTVFLLPILRRSPCNSLYSPTSLHLSPPCVNQIVGFDHCPISTFLKSLRVAIRLNITVKVSPSH